MTQKRIKVWVTTNVTGGYEASPQSEKPEIYAGDIGGFVPEADPIDVCEQYGLSLFGPLKKNQVKRFELSAREIK